METAETPPRSAARTPSDGEGAPPAARPTGGDHTDAPTGGGADRPWGLDALGDRFPAADGARAVAAFGVVLTHVGLLSGFNFEHPLVGQYLARTEVGVSIFFVLSGFLLYRPMAVRHLAGAPRGDVRNYARRRLLRIFPAYWVALTIIAFVLRAPPFTEPHSIVAHYLLLQIYDPNQVVFGPIDQAWSLATEVSFYTFLPLWAWLVSRARRPAPDQLRAESVSLAALWAGCLALNVAVILMGVSGPRFGQLGTWLPFRVHEFVLGMGLAVASAWLRQSGRALPTRWSGTRLTLGCWAVAAALFWAAATRMGFPLTLDFSPWQALWLRVVYSFIGLFFVLPLVLGRQDRGLARTLLANPVAVWLGLVSYGVYIWHKAIQYKYMEWTGQEDLNASFVGMLVVTVVVSLIAAAGSWYLVERPLLRRRDHLARAAART